jgi:hypothetical protein
VRTLSHFGDWGDLLSAMSIFPALGGDIDLVLYPCEGRCRLRVEQLRPFLEMQPYISRVRFETKPEGEILDKWREDQSGRLNLAQMVARAMKIPHPCPTTAWLTVDRVRKVAPVVVHRSPRYTQGSRFQWRKIFEHYTQGGLSNVVCVGSPEEYDSLNWAVGGGLQYVETPTVLDLARVIAGAELFIGNQSSPYWIATGMMKNTWLEQHRNRPGNCWWPRAGAVFDRYHKFPDVSGFVWDSKACESRPPAGTSCEIADGRVVLPAAGGRADECGPDLVQQVGTHDDDDGGCHDC